MEFGNYTFQDPGSGPTPLHGKYRTRVRSGSVSDAWTLSATYLKAEEARQSELPG